MERFQWNILFRNIPVYIFSTIPIEYIVQEYPCSAQLQWNILFTVQEYSCLHVSTIPMEYIVQEYSCVHIQHNTNGIYCLLFRNIPVYMFSTIPMEYNVYCSGIFLSTCSALYRWNILFRNIPVYMFSTIPMEYIVQEYPCLHVQHYTDVIYCSGISLCTCSALYRWHILFRNIPVYMFSTIPMETSEYLDPVRAEILKRADMRSDNF